MKKYIFTLYCLFYFFATPTLSAESLHDHSFWRQTDSETMMQFARLFPTAKDLKEVIQILTTQTAVTLEKLNVAALPGAPASTGTISGDLALIQTALGNLPVAAPTIGGAIAATLDKLNVPALPGAPPSTGTIPGDLAIVQTALGNLPVAAPTIGGAIASLKTQIDPTNGVNNLPLAIQNVQSAIGSGANLLAGVVGEKDRIDATVQSLALARSNVETLIIQPLPAGFTIRTGLNTILTRLGTGITLDAGVTAIIQKIDTPILPGNPVSTGNIMGDLTISVAAIKPGLPLLHLSVAILEIIEKTHNLPAVLTVTQALNDTKSLLGTAANTDEFTDLQTFLSILNALSLNGMIVVWLPGQYAQVGNIKQWFQDRGLWPN